MKLFDVLGIKHTHICGTLRKDRKHLPKKVISKKLKKGQCVAMHCGNISVCKWKDKRDVYTMLNMHCVMMVPTTNRKGDMKMKPNTVRDYNKHMSASIMQIKCSLTIPV